MMSKRCATWILLLISLCEYLSAKEIMTIENHPCIAGHILVQFHPLSLNQFQNRARHRLMSQFNVKAETVRHFASGAELWHVDSDLTIEILKTLKNDPDIKFAEPDYIYQTEIIPNDPFFPELWGLHNIGQSGGMNDADIDAPEAWELERGRGDVIVGIIDSGIDYTHPDLEANLWINPGEIADNGIDDDQNGYVDDVRGYDFDAGTPVPMDACVHGTHVSGTIGAVSNNGIGSCGIAWNVQLMPLKFMDEDGRGSASDAVAAIEYAIQMGADILNLSWGGTAFSETLLAGLASSDSAGLLIVCSAGNAGVDNDVTPHYPSSFELDNLISVTASDNHDGLPDFANWAVESVDLAAPGVSILSTAPDNKYGFMSGSSMAAPHVAGTGALLWSHFPEAAAVDLKRKILASVDKKESLIGSSQTAGRLNAFAALTDSSFQQLACQPDYVEFSITLKDQQSEPHQVYLSNNSDDTLTIDAMNAPDGFLIGHGAEPGTMVTSFTILPWYSDSLDIVFAPTEAMEYRQFFHIEYSNLQNTQVKSVQLYGRAVDGTLVPSGSIAGVWDRENAPYYILGDVSVVGSLVIQSGVNVEFQGPYSITVASGATFKAIGAEHDSISFYAYNPGEGWRGLRFIGSSNDDQLSYCDIRDGLKLKSADLTQDQNGGAIYCSASSPNIENCRISNNYAIAGGAIYLTASHPKIQNSVIVNNRALSDGGGGIYCYESNPALFRVVVSNNRALNFFSDSDNGGGIFCWAASPALLNVTLAGNVADKGGAIYIAQKGSNPTIVNSILWDNIPNSAEFSNDPKAKSLVVAYSDVEGGENKIDTGAGGMLYWLNNNFEADPNFVDTEHSDFRLIQGSVCIDAAAQNTTVTYDQGQIDIPTMSFLGSAPDLGACESHLVLPVELTTFSAHQYNNDAILYWSTASETNNFTFDILRSENDKDFVKIGSVVGHGTTSQEQNYSFVDKNVPAGRHFYQLCQIDCDGTQTHSSSVCVNIEGPAAFHLYPGYPNPFNSTATIRYDIPQSTWLLISIYNAMGQNIKTLIDEHVNAGSHRIQWDATNDSNKPVSSGLYFITLKTADKTERQKIMVLR